MMVRIELNPSDWGRSVIRSIDTYWKGPSLTVVSKCFRGALLQWRLVLDSWHLAHPFTYSSTRVQSLGPSYDCLTRLHVLAIPGCPPAGLSCISRQICRLVSGSSLRKILLMNRWSGRRIWGSSVFTPLLRSLRRDRRSATMLVCPGIYLSW